MVQDALLGERLSLVLVLVRIRASSQGRRDGRRFRVGRSSVVAAVAVAAAVDDVGGSGGVGEDGSEFFEVAAPIAGFFHLVDGHLEGSARQAFVFSCGGRGGGCRRSMVDVGGCGEERAVEMMAEEEEALKTRLGGGLVARNVGFEVEGRRRRWFCGGFHDVVDCWREKGWRRRVTKVCTEIEKNKKYQIKN